MNSICPQSKLWPFVEHGGRVLAAEELWPLAPRPWIDLSTGICPWPYPIPELPVETWTRLPDPGRLSKLQDVARVAYGVADTTRVVCAPGSELLLSILPRLMEGRKRVAIVGPPTYGGHARAWSAAGHDVTYSSQLTAGTNDIVIVVNPNNPDGRAHAPGSLCELAGELEAHSGLLIVDEAFADVVPGLSLLNTGAMPANAIVLKSIGKFYGLGGIRLGFAVTRHNLARLLQHVLGDWCVSGAAIEIGIKALNDTAWAEDNRKQLSSTALRLDELLIKSGFEIRGGTSLFRLTYHPEGLPLFHRLAEHGILLRPLTDTTLLRFGLPGSELAWSRLEAALAR